MKCLKKIIIASAMLCTASYGCAAPKFSAADLLIPTPYKVFQDMNPANISHVLDNVVEYILPFTQKYKLWVFQNVNYTVVGSASANPYSVPICVAASFFPIFVPFSYSIGNQSDIDHAAIDLVNGIKTLHTFNAKVTYASDTEIISSVTTPMSASPAHDVYIEAWPLDDRNCLKGFAHE